MHFTGKMRILNYTYSFLKLIRWPNLIIIGAVQAALYYVIICGIYKQVGIPTALDNSGLLILIGITLLIAGAGYIINDYFDIRTDRINRPEKVILGKKFSRKSGFTMQMTMNAIAVLAGFYISFIAGSWRLGLIFPMMVMLLWLYSVKYKRIPIWGNIAVAFLTAMSILIVWLFEFFMLRKHPDNFLAVVPYLSSITRFFAMFALFAFLLTFLREIIKDAEDLKGDAMTGMHTFAVDNGTAASVKLAMVITGLSALIILFVSGNFIIKGMVIAGIYYAVTVFIPLVWLIFKIYKANEISDFHQLSSYIKIIMIAGIIGLQPIAMSLT